MSNSSVTASASVDGVGFGGLLVLLFIALKLTGVIAWSWVWVLSPIWIGLAAWVLIVLIGILVIVLLDL